MVDVLSRKTLKELRKMPKSIIKKQEEEPRILLATTQIQSTLVRQIRKGQTEDYKYLQNKQ